MIQPLYLDTAVPRHNWAKGKIVTQNLILSKDVFGTPFQIAYFPIIFKYEGQALLQNQTNFFLSWL